MYDLIKLLVQNLLILNLNSTYDMININKGCDKKLSLDNLNIDL